MAIHELCGYCGDRVADCTCSKIENNMCASCNGDCRCDANYDAMREANV